MSGQCGTLRYARLCLTISAVVSMAWPAMRLVEVILHPSWFGDAVTTAAAVSTVLSLALQILTRMAVKRHALRTATIANQLDAYQQAWRILAPYSRPVFTAISHSR